MEKSYFAIIIYLCDREYFETSLDAIIKLYFHFILPPTIF